MRLLTSEEICSMEVINLCDGARLGCPESIEIDVSCGNITALLIPCDSGLSCLLPWGRRDLWRIPWCKIECLGEDTILVKLTRTELDGCCTRRESRRSKKEK